MRLPHAERAIADIEKLRSYCLNSAHPRGKHKAHVFETALGIRADQAHLLRDALLEAARNSPAVLGEEDPYGTRYVVDFRWSTPVGAATIRSVWIVRKREDFPRLTTCFVL